MLTFNNKRDVQKNVKGLYINLLLGETFLFNEVNQVTLNHYSFTEKKTHKNIVIYYSMRLNNLETTEP